MKRFQSGKNTPSHPGTEVDQLRMNPLALMSIGRDLNVSPDYATIS